MTKQDALCYRQSSLFILCRPSEPSSNLEALLVLVLRVLSASPAAAQWLFAPRVWPGPTYLAGHALSLKARGDKGARRLRPAMRDPRLAWFADEQTSTGEVAASATTQSAVLREIEFVGTTLDCCPMPWIGEKESRKPFPSVRGKQGRYALAMDVNSMARLNKAVCDARLSSSRAHGNLFHSASTACLSNFPILALRCTLYTIPVRSIRWLHSKCR